MSKSKEKHICDVHCMYYPRYPSEILDEYIDEFGLKHRDSIWICGYDDHMLLDYQECKHYKNLCVRR
jgi:hypothetical protein